MPVSTANHVLGAYFSNAVADFPLQSTGEVRLGAQHDPTHNACLPRQIQACQKQSVDFTHLDDDVQSGRSSVTLAIETVKYQTAFEQSIRSRHLQNSLGCAGGCNGNERLCALSPPAVNWYEPGNRAAVFADAWSRTPMHGASTCTSYSCQQKQQSAPASRRPTSKSEESISHGSIRSYDQIPSPRCRYSTLSRGRSLSTRPGLRCKTTRQRRPDETSSKSKRYGCPQCGNTFQYPKDLKRHQLTHGVLFPHACSRCHRRFKRFDNTQRHERKCTKGTGELSSESASIKSELTGVSFLGLSSSSCALPSQSSSEDQSSTRLLNQSCVSDVVLHAAETRPEDLSQIAIPSIEIDHPALFQSDSNAFSNETWGEAVEGDSTQSTDASGTTSFVHPSSGLPASSEGHPTSESGRKRKSRQPDEDDRRSKKSSKPPSEIGSPYGDFRCPLPNCRHISEDIGALIKHIRTVHSMNICTRCLFIPDIDRDRRDHICNEEWVFYSEQGRNHVAKHRELSSRCFAVWKAREAQRQSGQSVPLQPRPSTADTTMYSNTSWASPGLGSSSFGSTQPSQSQPIVAAAVSNSGAWDNSLIPLLQPLRGPSGSVVSPSPAPQSIFHSTPGQSMPQAIGHVGRSSQHSRESSVLVGNIHNSPTGYRTPIPPTPFAVEQHTSSNVRVGWTQPFSGGDRYPSDASTAAIVEAMVKNPLLNVYGDLPDLSQLDLTNPGTGNVPEVATHSLHPPATINPRQLDSALNFQDVSNIGQPMPRVAHGSSDRSFHEIPPQPAQVIDRLRAAIHYHRYRDSSVTSNSINELGDHKMVLSILWRLLEVENSPETLPGAYIYLQRIELHGAAISHTPPPLEYLGALIGGWLNALLRNRVMHTRRPMPSDEQGQCDVLLPVLSQAFRPDFVLT